MNIVKVVIAAVVQGNSSALKEIFIGMVTHTLWQH